MTITLQAAQALDKRLAILREERLTRPPQGWLRAIRHALGMTSTQLAARLGVSQPRVMKLEKGEAEDTLTLASLRRAAEAMDCELVYAVVPRRPLIDTLQQRAELVADRQLRQVSHTMSLENQALAGDDQRRQRALLIDRLLRGDPKRLWDEA